MLWFCKWDKFLKVNCHQQLGMVSILMIEALKKKYSHPSARKAITKKQQEIESAVPSTTTHQQLKSVIGNWQYNSFKNGYLLWFKVIDSLPVLKKSETE